VASDIPSDLSTPPGDAGRRRGRRTIPILCATALTCLAVAVAAGTAAHRELARAPTAAQRAAAAAMAVTARWHSWRAGLIFPPALSYSTSLLTTETATRVGIAPQSACASAIDPALRKLAVRDRCQAALRATYVDELQGVLYTVGVLAFPTARDASAFATGLSASTHTTIPLRALALPGTASALFRAAAGQSATARHDGSFVVLTVAGYADGEPSGPGQEARAAIFGPAAQLAGEVIRPLTRSPTVNCASKAWSC